MTTNKSQLGGESEATRYVGGCFFPSYWAATPFKANQKAANPKRQRTQTAVVVELDTLLMDTPLDRLKPLNGWAGRMEGRLRAQRRHFYSFLFTSFSFGDGLARPTSPPNHIIHRDN